MSLRSSTSLIELYSFLNMNPQVWLCPWWYHDFFVRYKLNDFFRTLTTNFGLMCSVIRFLSHPKEYERIQHTVSPFSSQHSESGHRWVRSFWNFTICIQNENPIPSQLKSMRVNIWSYRNRVGLVLSNECTSCPICATDFSDLRWVPRNSLINSLPPYPIMIKD